MPVRLRKQHLAKTKPETETAKLEKGTVTSSQS